MTSDEPIGLEVEAAGVPNEDHLFLDWGIEI
jgi:hypothetical protein